MSSPLFTSASLASWDHKYRTVEEAPQTQCQITFSFTNMCVSVRLCVCSRWCNNLCSLPHYTVLHRTKWVLSMFLHLNYTTENNRQRRGRRGGGGVLGQLIHRAERSKAPSVTLGDLFALGKMWHRHRCLQMVFSKSMCKNENEYDRGHCGNSVISGCEVKTAFIFNMSQPIMQITGFPLRPSKLSWVMAVKLYSRQQCKRVSYTQKDWTKLL